MELFIIGLVIIIAINAYRSKKAKSSTASLDQVLAQKRGVVTTVSTSSVPGKNITSVIGAVSGKSKTQASTQEEFDLAEKEAMLSIIENAQRLGANAIIDLKATTGTYQQQGSQWQVSQTMYSGTAVCVE
ncbi:MAG: heavy metal-binding domain-containing protein [Armatimonadetes bacterium]|nr:heavy metal-binding domain-containing protein [Armatimonadota bacterium]